MLEQPGEFAHPDAEQAGEFHKTEGNLAHWDGGIVRAQETDDRAAEGDRFGALDIEETVAKSFIRQGMGHLGAEIMARDPVDGRRILDEEHHFQCYRA